MPSEMIATKAEHSSSDPVIRRAGPAGRMLRIAVGVLLLVSIAGFYVKGSLPFVLRSAFATVALFVIYVLIHRFIAILPAAARRRWLVSILALVPVVVIYVLGMGSGAIFGAGIGQLAAFTFLGISLVLAGVRGDLGCEVMTVPNLLSGRDSEIQCLVFTSVDRIEKRLADRRS